MPRLPTAIGRPFCPYIPADAVDACVVEAFFQALSPLALDLYARACAAQPQARTPMDHAPAQALERLRYQAARAQRQFSRVEPENRLVAAALESRWEAAVRALKPAEAAYMPQQHTPVVPLALTAELKATFRAIGHNLPQLWHRPVLSHQQKKAWLRGLMDTVALHRATRDPVHPRIVWKGGEPTTFESPIPVGSFHERSSANEMEPLILQLSSEGKTDPEIAMH